MKVFRYFEDDSKFLQFNIRDLHENDIVTVLNNNEIFLGIVKAIRKDEEYYYAEVLIFKIEDYSLVEPGKSERSMLYLAQPIDQIIVKKCL